MQEEGQYRLIVGLGNPGKEYDNTRHNAGFMALRYFAKEHGLSFRYSSQVKGELASGQIGEHKVLLLLPQVFMNHSGMAVKLCSAYYKVDIDHVLVVCDDAAIPFSSCRYRSKGSAGGHNGLKSIEACLGSQDYHRIRMGIGGPEHETLADHVLNEFTKAEQDALPEILKKVAHMLQLWLSEEISQGITT